VLHAGAGVPSNGQSGQGAVPLGANAGDALKMRSPDIAMIVTATVLIQCVARAMGWWRGEGAVVVMRTRRHESSDEFRAPVRAHHGTISAWHV
jgi:hypothetical protein